MYYNGFQTLTYNALFNFVIGNRSAGKTFWFKDWAIKDFLKTGNQFIYMRRYKTEIKKIGKFFEDIAFKYPDVKLEVKGRDFYINDKAAGSTFVLSTAKAEKSVPFPKVNKLCYDEFIIDKGVYRYLDDEPQTFEEAYVTIARPGTNHPDVRTFFMGNAVTFVNPLFLHYNIQRPYNSNIWRNGEILLELVGDAEMIARQKATRFGQIVKGTDFESYAFDNKFLRDNSEFIGQKTGNPDFLFAIKYNDFIFGVWISYAHGKMWVSKDVENTDLMYALTLDDHSINTMLIKSVKNAHLFKQFLDAYKNGCVFFEDMTIKNLIYEVIKKTMF